MLPSSAVIPAAFPPVGLGSVLGPVAALMVIFVIALLLGVVGGVLAEQRRAQASRRPPAQAVPAGGVATAPRSAA